MEVSDKRIEKNPRSWLRIFSWLILILLVPASLFLALFGLASINDSYSHDTDKAWGIASAAEAVPLFLSGLTGVLYMIMRKRTLGDVAVLFLALSSLGSGGVVILGVQALNDANRRGGDWGALAVLGTLIFQILFPALLGLSSMASGACLLVLRSKAKSESQD